MESSLVLLEEGFCYDQCILLAKLCYPFPYFILYSEAKLACEVVMLLIKDLRIIRHLGSANHTRKAIKKGHITCQSGCGEIRTPTYTALDNVK